MLTEITYTSSEVVDFFDLLWTQHNLGAWKRGSNILGTKRYVITLFFLKLFDRQEVKTV